MSEKTAWVQCCPYCGGLPHAGVCPMVRAIEYHPDGSVKRVEFHAPAPFNPNDWHIPPVTSLGGKVST